MIKLKRKLNKQALVEGTPEVPAMWVNAPWFIDLRYKYGLSKALKMGLDARTSRTFTGDSVSGAPVAGVVTWADTSYRADWQTATLWDVPMTTSKQHLANFLEAYLEWAAADARCQHSSFSKRDGLCTNLVTYLGEVLPRPIGYAYSRDAMDVQYERDGVRSLMRQLLEVRVGPGDYPFGVREYYTCLESGTQHKFPPRIAFAKGVLADLRNGTI